MPQLPSVATSATEAAPSTATTQQHGIDYYRSTVDDDAAILEERRQRQYEERQRKKEQKKFEKQYGHWNPQAPHNPQRYSNLKAYRASGGWARKKADFEAFLRQQKLQSRESGEASEVNAASNSSRPTSSSSPQKAELASAKPSFAPPASYDPPSASAAGSEHSEEDPYARRIRLSQQQQHAPPPPPPPPADASYQAPPAPPSAGAPYPPPPPPPPPPSASTTHATYQGATISAPPVRYAGATISAPPVRFERPDVPMGDADAPAYEERPAKRPKLTPAEAMMAKMGYVKGQGLGKNNDGVISHLEVKMRKDPRGRSTLDDEGGKVKSQQVWDVSGGLRTQKDEPGKFGEESSVVVTWGCVDSIDWHANAMRNDGGVRQDMGEAFGAKVRTLPSLGIFI
jgi:splicing factor 45